jgi:Phytanoyl-CoA dioxygenase (PhyH)
MVSTRLQETPSAASTAHAGGEGDTAVRRSGRERRPPESILQAMAVSSPAFSSTNPNRKLPPLSSQRNKGNKKNSNARRQQLDQSRRKTVPHSLNDPRSGETVWISTATLQDITAAQKRRKAPWPLYKRYLVLVPSPQQRQFVYDQAAAALQELEERLLPRYGSRLQWRCQVTIRESNAKSPYFLWNARGELELAAWPYMVEKVPDPPRFPGYYVPGSSPKRRSKAQAKKEKPPVPPDETVSSTLDEAVDETNPEDIKNPPVDQEPVVVSQADDVDVDEESEDTDSEDEDEEEEEISEEIRQLRELQERPVTGLAELAFAERWRIPIPTIHYKWISPLQQTYYTRKSAWEQAVALCRNDILMDKILTGYGANGRPVQSLKGQTQSAVFKAGKLRFERDGLWVVGQEEDWAKERFQLHSEDISNQVQTPEAPSTTPQPRRWTGLTYYIHQKRVAHRQQRLLELSLKPPTLPTVNVVTPPASTGSGGADSPVSSSSEATDPESSVTQLSTMVVMETPPRTQPPNGKRTAPKFTLVDAEKELRIVWKQLPGQEKLNWTAEAKKVQEELDRERGDIHPTDIATALKPTETCRKYTDLNRSRKWCLSDSQIKMCYDAGVEHYDQIMRTVTARDLFRELQDGFDLLRERGKGRWDMNLPDFDLPQYNFLNDTKKSPWMPIVKEILGKDVVLIHKGIFLSMPGSSKQVYHQDGPHLTTQYQKPCHAINVFVPLIDLTLDNGPTEFCLGSHMLGYDELKEDFITTPTVAAGTPVIFDYRLGHRGLGNTSDTCRPILYCTYAASADGKEFRDSVNFSRKRYHRIGDLVEKGLTRAERAAKRQLTMSEEASEQAVTEATSKPHSDHGPVSTIANASAISDIEIVSCPSTKKLKHTQYDANEI